MTEAEWLASEDATSMLRFVGQTAGDRKLRLFACACSRDIFGDDLHTSQSIALAERYADGLSDQSERDSVLQNLSANDLLSAWVLDSNMVEAAPFVTEHFGDDLRRLALACVRDIFGNPFRPVTFSPAWRTEIAVALATQMYESRDFGAMPILADALQDAGCDNDDILNHCRGDGPHVRGCWVVDLVLGK